MIKYLKNNLMKMLILILLGLMISMNYSTNAHADSSNLINDGGFEIDSDDTWEAYSTDNAEFIWDGNVYHGTNGHSANIKGSKTSGFLCNTITVQPNQVYTFSAWKKAQDVTTDKGQLGTAISIVQLDSDGDIIDSTEHVFDEEGTFGWKQVSCNFVTNSDAVSVFVVLSLEGSGSVWYDDVSLTASENGIPSAWSPVRANPGWDRSTFIGFNTKLDASKSVGNSLSYSWRIISKPDGSQSELKESSSVNSDFTPDVPGDYTIGLTVTEGKVTSQEQVITIRAKKMNDTSDDMSYKYLNHSICISGYEISDMVPLCDGWVILSDNNKKEIVILNGITGEVAKEYHLNAAPTDIDFDFDNNIIIATQQLSSCIAKIDVTTDLVSYITTSGQAKVLSVGEGNIAFAYTEKMNSSNYYVEARNISIIDYANNVELNSTPTGKDCIGYIGFIKYDKVNHNLILGPDGYSPSKLFRYTYDVQNKSLTYAEYNQNTGGFGADLAISNDGKHLAFTCKGGNGSGYTIYDYDSSKISNYNGFWDIGAFPSSADFSSDSKYLVATNRSKIMLFDVDSHTFIKDIYSSNDGHYFEINKVRFSKGNGIVFNCYKYNGENNYLGSEIYLNKSGIVNSADPVTIDNINIDNMSPITTEDEVNFTVDASGGIDKLYGFLLYDGNAWSTLQEYSASNTFTWKPTELGSYTIVTVAKDKSSSNNYDDLYVTNYEVYIPSFEPYSDIDSGEVPAGTNISLFTDMDGADIYYTLDGSTPTKTSKQYTDPIEITKAVTIKAIAISDTKSSGVSTFDYTVAAMEKVALPVANPASSSVASGTEVTLTTATEGAAIYYTLDNSTPTTNSTLYTAPIKITSATTLKAIAVKKYMSNSDVLTATYSISSSNGGGSTGGGSNGGGGGPIGPIGPGPIVGPIGGGNSKLGQNELIILNAPKAITYGNATYYLTTAGGSGKGSVSYEVTSGDAISIIGGNIVKILKAGNATITATKAGDDTYNSTTATVNIVISKASVVIETAPTIKGAIDYGATLSTIKLNGGKASAPGEFVWKNPDLTVNKSGSYEVIFIPKESDKYFSADTLINGESIKIKVNVSEKPKTLTFVTSAKTIALDQTYHQKAIVDNGKNNAYITYSSSNTSVAIVDSEGIVTSKKVGITYITATTSNGLTAKYKIEVKKAPKKITISKKSITIEDGKSITLKPSAGKGCYASYTFTSSDNKVATVSKNGKVKAKKAGTTIITIKTQNGIEITCKIKVK